MGAPGGSISLLNLRAIMRYARALLLHFVPKLTPQKRVFSRDISADFMAGFYTIQDGEKFYF